MIAELIPLFDDVELFDEDELVAAAVAPPSTGGGQVGGNLALIETGPCGLTFRGVALGHTLEGMKVSISSDLRERLVDEYGKNVVELIGQADRVEIKATLMQKSLAVLQTVYQMSYGAISSSLVGIGRLPGKKATERSGQLVIHRIGSHSSQDVVFFNVAVAGSGEVNFGTVTADRTFEVTWRCLVDESQSNGQLLGQIGVVQ